MSKTPNRKDVEEGEAPGIHESVGNVTVLDPFGDPAFLPPADINENAGALVVRLEIPGVLADDVEVFVQNETIEVVGEKKRDLAGSGVSFLCLERSFGKFRRTFEVTGCLNMGLVKAVLANGVLVLSIPKCEDQRGRRRRVKVEAE